MVTHKIYCFYPEFYIIVQLSSLAKAYEDWKPSWAWKKASQGMECIPKLAETKHNYQFLAGNSFIIFCVSMATLSQSMPESAVAWAPHPTFHITLNLTIYFWQCNKFPHCFFKWGRNCFGIHRKENNETGLSILEVIYAHREISSQLESAELCWELSLSNICYLHLAKCHREVIKNICFQHFTNHNNFD